MGGGGNGGTGTNWMSTSSRTAHKILVILERNYDRTFYKSLIVCAGVLSFNASGQVYMYEIEP